MLQSCLIRFHEFMKQPICAQPSLRGQVNDACKKLWISLSPWAITCLCRLAGSRWNSANCSSSWKLALLTPTARTQPNLHNQRSAVCKFHCFCFFLFLLQKLLSKLLSTSTSMPGASLCRFAGSRRNFYFLILVFYFLLLLPLLL